jgi:hypothetical protein
MERIVSVLVPKPRKVETFPASSTERGADVVLTPPSFVDIFLPPAGTYVQPYSLSTDSTHASHGIDLTEYINALVEPLADVCDSINILSTCTHSKARKGLVLVQLSVDKSLDYCEQSYEITMTSSGTIHIIGKDSPGLYFGVVTLGQIWRVLKWKKHKSQNLVLGGGFRVVDWPSMFRRGVLYDISRGRVPTLSFLKSLIQLLSRLKYNEIQLYCEHAFAYKEHEGVWQGCSPLTPGDIFEIDAFCAYRHVKLIPNQNTLGHMHRWLKHSKYNKLAECPTGHFHPFSLDREPFSLDASDPGSFDLATSLVSELRENFRCKETVNLNLDEAFDLGLGKSKYGPLNMSGPELYIDYMKRLQAWCDTEGIKEMMVWGDFFNSRPQELASVPKKNCTILEWGYDDNHPFEANCSKIKENNLPFYVCPGTSSWTSFSGRTTNSIRNIYLAVAAGMRHGAKGFMITDWGDSGHLQPPCISYLPFVVGAGTSWGTEDGLQEANVEGLQSLKRRNGLSAIFAKIMSAWEASLLFRIFAVSVAIVPGSLVFGTFFCVLPLLLIPFEYFCCFIDSDSYHRYIASQEDLERRVSNVDVNSKNDRTASIFCGAPDRYYNLLDCHVFLGDAHDSLGKILFQIGDVYRILAKEIPNGTLMFWGAMLNESFFNNRLTRFMFDIFCGIPFMNVVFDFFGLLYGRCVTLFVFGITPYSIVCTKYRVRQILAEIEELEKHTTRDEDTSLVVAELHWIADMLLFSCSIWEDRIWVGIHQPLSSLPLQSRRLKHGTLLSLIKRHKQLWTTRSRFGGLGESVRYLETVLMELSNGEIAR